LNILYGRKVYKYSDCHISNAVCCRPLVPLTAFPFSLLLSQLTYRNRWEMGGKAEIMSEHQKKECEVEISVDIWNWTGVQIRFSFSWRHRWKRERSESPKDFFSKKCILLLRLLQCICPMYKSICMYPQCICPMYQKPIQAFSFPHFPLEMEMKI